MATDGPASHPAERRVVESAHRYDLAALVEELHALGYPDDAIEFRSNQTLRHQAAVVESVELVTQPERRAIVTVNLSLLGPQSPLPTYFRQALDNEIDSSLSAFLNFFSHRLVRADVLGMFPERDGGLFGDFGRTKLRLLSLLGLRSLSAVHWLFERLYPELEVAVRRTVLERPVRTRGMILGDWALGDGSVCGGAATAPVSAIGVTLFCDEPYSHEGEPWAREAERRLHGEAFPLIATHGLFLEVALVFRDQASFMVLAPKQFLGYEPIFAGEGPSEAGTRTSRTVILWTGEVPRQPR